MATPKKLVIDCSLSRPPDKREQYVDLTPAEIAQQAKDAADAVTQAWRMLRSERNARLSASDWTQLPDANLSPADKARWDQYRTLLRDLPAQTQDPQNPQWPGAPGAPG